jgi:1-acyl-sn-glycerol-3-phosphate acyltransferase
MINTPVQIILNLLYGFFGLLSFLFITVHLAFWIVPIVILALIKLVVPVQFVKELSYRIMVWIYGTAVRINDFLLFKLVRNKIQIRSKETLKTDRNYLILSNHRSWADILILQSVLNRKTPPIRFIVKWELIFMPIVGLICWAYEYPFVKRKSLKYTSPKSGKSKNDFHVIRNKIDKMSANHLSLINFVEGTRFKILKSEKYAAGFKHLLNPHAGGLFNILKNYGDRLDELLNFTIVYKCRQPIFWKLLGGRCRHIIVDLQKVQMKELLNRLGACDGDVNFVRVSEWLNDLWQEKDLKIDELIAEPELK